MSKKIHILGSGMAALGAAHHCHENNVDCVLFDKNPYPGGHTATFKHDNGFVFDDGPHISFTKDERLRSLFASNVGGNVDKPVAVVNNYYHGNWIKHPVQTNLYNVPNALKTKCILDFIEVSSDKNPDKPANYLDWLTKTYGETIATSFPAVYGTKYHTVGPELMSTVWIGPRMYRPTLEEVITGAIEEETDDVHYVSDFRYPKKDGFFAFLKPFCDKSELHLDHEVSQIDAAAKTIEFTNGHIEKFEQLVSSIPLDDLVPMIKDAPSDVLEAAAKLACTQCVTVNIGVDRDDFTKATWTYIYDEDIVMTRLSFPHNMSPGTCPEGCGSIQAEVYFSDKYKPMDVDADSLVDLVIKDLIRIGLLKEDENIIHAEAKFIKHANIIFDLDREDALPIVHKWLDEIGINYVGRFGEWGYHWTDEAFKSGERGARETIEKMSQHD